MTRRKTLTSNAKVTLCYLYIRDMDLMVCCTDPCVGIAISLGPCRSVRMHHLQRPGQAGPWAIGSEFSDMTRGIMHGWGTRGSQGFLMF